MLISHYVSNVQSDLTRLGQLGGESLADALARLGDAAEPALRGRLFEALNQIIAEANDSTPNLNLELRLGGDEITIVREEPPLDVVETPTDLNARFALRLPEELKTLIDDRANRSGASTNSWIVKALAKEMSESASRALGRSGRNLRGTGRS